MEYRGLWKFRSEMWQYGKMDPRVGWEGEWGTEINHFDEWEKKSLKI